MSYSNTINKNIFAKITKDIAKYRVNTDNKYIAFLFKSDDFTITIYNSKKILFQGKKAKEMHDKYFTAKATKVNSVSTKPSSGAPLVGSDEVGVGDYFGPLVVCACYVDENIKKQVSHLDIKDTKQLTDIKIIALANTLEKIVPFELEMFNNVQMNKLTEEGHNGHVLKSILHNKCHAKLAMKYPGCQHIIDQYVAKDTYYRYFEKLGIEPLRNIHFETKAENKFIAVAIAAIIARKYFLKEIDKISEKIGKKIPLGAGSHVDSMIRIIRNDLGEDTLKSVSKYNFANTKKTM